MRVLGISCFYHDSAAALLEGGRVVAAVQEERLSRRKHDPAFPARAIASVLEQAGLTGRDLDLLCFHEKPLRKFDRLLETTAAVAPRGARRFADAMPSWFLDKLRVEDKLRELTGSDARFVCAGHHESHAASAFFLSPFERAATLTTDGVGEWTTNAIGRGEGHRLELLQELRFPHSLGLLYSAFTQYLGFRVNNGEYKVMGLAPYGTPRYADLIREHLVEVREDGSYTLNLAHFDYLIGDSTIGPSFPGLFGQPTRAPDGPLTAFHMDMARSIQAVTEDIVLAQARHVRATTGESKLVLAGGVALNSVANGKLAASGLFDEIWIQPAAGDAGGALGAALIGHHHVLQQPRPTPPRAAPHHDGMQGAYLGPAYGPAAVEQALATTQLSGQVLDEPTLVGRVADLLAEGKVVGWFQGRMEFGPRALGHRSILADPRQAAMQRRVNAKIKFREGFRPFAPAVPAEVATDWFDLTGPSPYMLQVVPVTAAQRLALTPEQDAAEGLDRLWVERSTVPAVTHVDGSARVQTVHADTNPRFHALLTAMGERTGVPVLMNTSFNLRGEPIVASPLDAARTFLASGMDALVLGDHLILRPEGAEPTGVPPAPPPTVTPPRTQHDLRVFGLGGGAILGTLAALQAWGGHTPWALGLGLVAAVFALPGALYPEALRGLESVFGAVGKKLGAFNSRVLLTALYWGVLTPISWARRAMGTDPLAPAEAPVGDGTWRPIDHRPDDLARYDRLY